MYPESALGGGKLGDGVGFPDVKLFSVGLWWPNASNIPIVMGVGVHVLSGAVLV